ncbi:hypothetical protein [Streptomyces sp. D2-8]|uniref:hypothetical protein n=1 Tax=Streptomyces sp. D2-8 TaxID=2707767 RepID=UPI0020BDA501|nr:hypothetical protein [Streptomyces sp. D2-8]
MTRPRRTLTRTDLALVSGPLTLIEGDFPHPGRMREIAEHNLHQALSLLKSAS